MQRQVQPVSGGDKVVLAIAVVVFGIMWLVFIGITLNIIHEPGVVYPKW